jgi:hypothetical protein
MRRIGLTMSLLLMLASALLLGSQDESGAADSASAQDVTPAVKRDAKGKKLGVTPERQAAVMTFVKRNHPELAELLTHLKVRQPDEYEGAVRELFRTTERLAQIQERDPLQYELEVALWTAQSRVQLLTAKLMMGTTDELQAALRTAVGEQIDARVALLKHQRQKAADRAANLDREIRKVEGDRDQVIERQLQLLTRAASEGQPASIVPKSAAPKSSAKPVKKAKPAAE